MIPWPIYLFILIELVAVSYGDIKTNKIPNLWSIINLGAFSVLLLAAPQYYTLAPQTFLYSVVFLFVGFVLFLLRIMGGGDSKFLFTFFLLVPVSMHERTFYHLLLSTVLIGTFLLVQNTLSNWKTLIFALRTKDIKTVKSCFGTKFSYAPVILIAWLWMGWNLKDKF
ncbi:MAG: prepilin peptidase [Bacteriovoracaceae bacterium]|nr:prepilin peptidase [Bacteriovoracaceae bacterium]